MRKTKGFTLIELMIVIAIIAIIAAIAVPNLIQSRIRANEAAAISVVKQIAAAQVQFQVARQGRATGNTGAGPTGYADNYRNLFYGLPNGSTSENLRLVSQAIADAYVAEPSPTTGGAVRAGGPTTVTTAMAPYQGYHFVEPGASTTVMFQTTFGIVAIPNNSTRTGTNAYYLGEDGTVYQRGLASGQDLTAAAAMYGAQNLMGTANMTAFLGEGWAAL